jgi:macrocin-O-methyltransferase TylF-like protien
MADAPEARFDEKSGSRLYSSDAQIERRIGEHCSRFGVGPTDAVKLFPVLARRQNLKRFLAHSHLFQQTLGVPGDIAELGVYRGLGLMTWANLLEAFCIGDRTKMVFGFDNWAGFTRFAAEDGAEKQEAGKIIGGFNPTDFKQELLSAIDIYDNDRFVPWKPRIKLIDGDIAATVPSFLSENPGVRFSLVHFDCDLYEPTHAALNAIWPKLARGGILIFDEYGIHDWPGETAAVDQFLADKPDLRLQTFDWTNAPAAWLVKP